jgi:4-amino-4-deoxy-L-arabinose transferase-like glycosyltransferase
MRYKNLIILFVIILLASFLRLWQLGVIPPSPDWDEAALGYNAYSILQTGMDEYGEKFPVILKSFGDYKPALYVYLAIPSIALFDLTTLAIRFPSAVFGIITILTTYLFIRVLSKREDVALLSAFFLAISPWHIQFSRVAFETNIGLSLNILAALFFVYGLRKPLFLSLSALMLGLGLYAYQSEKVFVPLLFLILIIVFYQKLKAIPLKFHIAAIITGIIIAAPMVLALTRDASTTLGRAKGVSVFSAQSPAFDVNTQKVLYDKEHGDVAGQVLDNRRIFYARQIAENYLSHWDINWLFVKGDIGRHHAPGMGLLYLVELPLILMGIYALFFGKYPKDMKMLIVLWFLIAPIPASVTTGVPHAVRTFNFLPTFQVFSALGVLEIVTFLKGRKVSVPGLGKIGLRTGVALIICIGFLFNSTYYLDQYFVQQNYFHSEDWQYGYAQAVSKTKEIGGKYDKIVVTNAGYFDQSYIFYLFYLKFSPKEYQDSMSFIGDSKSDRRIGKYEFRKINWTTDKSLKNTLFIGLPDEFDDGSKGESTINFLNGKPAIKIVGT